jgi:hypothetical protein
MSLRVLRPFAAQKENQKGDNPTMNLLKTKTFWGGIAAIVTGVGLIYTGNVPEGINAVATGLLAIFVRDGVRKSNTSMPQL